MSGPLDEIAQKKYQQAGDIAKKAIADLKAKCVKGAKITDLTNIGDKIMEDHLSKLPQGGEGEEAISSKGIAFPTCISPNAVVSYLCPIEGEPEGEWKLNDGDLVKIFLGVHVDGYICCDGETFVVGTDSHNEEVSNAILGGWYAAQAALRTMRPGNRNWDVTNIVDKVTRQFDICALEAMLSQQQQRGLLHGDKKIILNPTPSSKKQIPTYSFTEGEVWHLDILVSPNKAANGKVLNKETEPTVFLKTPVNYNLKLKTSRAALAEAQKKTGGYPFALKSFDNPKRTRIGLRECVSHSVVIAYDVFYERDGKPIVQFFYTVAIGKEHNTIFAGSPDIDVTKYETDKKLDEETQKLVNSAL